MLTANKTTNRSDSTEEIRFPVANVLRELSECAENAE